MKYGREVSVGNEVRLTEVVEIPNPLPHWATDAAAFLAKMYPQYTNGWVLVADTNKSGDVKNGSVYGTPILPAPPTRYKSLSQSVVRDILDTVFGDTRTLAVDAALAALSTDVWKVRIKQFNNVGKVFTRQQVIDFLTAARNADIPTAGTKITVAEITAIANDPNWIEEAK